MNMTRLGWVYLTLAAIGAVVSLSAFLPWAWVYGLDVARFVHELFANRVSAFFGWDVIIAAVVTVMLIGVEGRCRPVPGAWMAILATLLIGVSAGLPLFLALRERGPRTPTAA